MKDPWVPLLLPTTTRQPTPKIPPTQGKPTWKLPPAHVGSVFGSQRLKESGAAVHKASTCVEIFPVTLGARRGQGMAEGSAEFTALQRQQEDFLAEARREKQRCQQRENLSGDAGWARN